jgi:site-specific recombinase XerD
MTQDSPPPTIAAAIAAYLAEKEISRPRSARTYGVAMRRFARLLEEAGVTASSPVADLQESHVLLMLEAGVSRSTLHLYMDIVVDFFQHLSVENIRPANLPKLRDLIKKKAPKRIKPALRYQGEAIDKVVAYADGLVSLPCDTPQARLRNLRDRALIMTLADTGLRIFEACSLVRGDIDWNMSVAYLANGKGEKPAVIRLSTRAMQALKLYLSERTPLMDGLSGKSLASLPVFSSHSRMTGKGPKPITTTTGRNIVNTHVIACLGDEAVGSITPHKFRHHFVTEVLLRTGNLRTAQELARHSSVSTTERYTHLANEDLDRAYYETFEAN